MRRLLLVTLAVLAVWPAAASAGTADLVFTGMSETSDGRPPVKLYALDVRADPGEANRLAVSSRGGLSVVLRDSGAPLRAGRGCVAEGDAVRCSPDGILDETTIDLGDGDDELRGDGSGTILGGPGADTILLEGGFATIDGGPGPDRMDTADFAFVDYRSRTAGVRATVGDGADDGEPGEGDDVGPGIDHVHGGAGDDVISAGAGGFSAGGGPGADVLTGSDHPDSLGGGPGDDRIDTRGGNDNLDADEGADVLRGGAGTDYLSYHNRTAPLHVTIDDRPGDGAAGEGDDVGTDVERVEGGEGDDHLEGFDGGQSLEGGKGADRLLGGPGADSFLEFGQGDTIVPGPGGDHLFLTGTVHVDARDGEADLVNCRGSDGSIRADSRVDGLVGCGLRPQLDATPLSASKTGRVVVNARCGSLFQGCEGTVRMRRGNRIIAERPLTIAPNTWTLARLRLARADRRTLRRRGKLNVTVELVLGRAGLPETSGTEARRGTVLRGRLPALRSPASRRKRAR